MTPALAARRRSLPRRHGAQPALPLQALVQGALARALHAASAADEPDAPSTMWVTRATEPTAPAQLAAAHPGGPAAQADARKLYRRCLDHYRAMAPDGDDATDADDAGAALASFLAANLQAVHGVAASAAQRRAIARQVAGLARERSGWDRLDLCERQQFVEQLAILGVLIAESSRAAQWQGAEAQAHVRRAACAYVQQLLGIDASRLAIGPDGLEPRGDTARRGARG